VGPSCACKAAELARTDTVLEIGPGTGVLTRFLAQRAKRIIAVEKDATLSTLLSAALAKEKITNVAIVTDDILSLFQTKSGMGAWLSQKKYKVVANIPYYLTSRLIRILLEQERRPEIIVLMIQREVAERAVAQPPDMNPAPSADKKPGTSMRQKRCGMNMLAFSVQAYGTPEIIADVPASCFHPRPKVDSAILKISGISDDFFTERHIAPKDFFALAKAGFSSRRKILSNNLQDFASKKELFRALVSLGHSSTARAQELSLEKWTALIRMLS